MRVIIIYSFQSKNTNGWRKVKIIMGEGRLYHEILYWKHQNWYKLIYLPSPFHCYHFLDTVPPCLTTQHIIDRNLYIPFQREDIYYI